MAQLKMYESSKHDRFDLTPENRNTRHIERLKESMKAFGWLTAYPMLVRKNGGNRLIIIDGHHRFKAAEELGIPVKYVIEDQQISMYELENTKNPWNMHDYLTSFCRADKADYIRLHEYYKRTGISIGQCAWLMGGQPEKKEGLQKFKTGKFKVKSMRLADDVSFISSNIHPHVPDVYRHRSFIAALVRIIQTNKLDFERFVERTSKHPHVLNTDVRTVEGFLDAIEAVYNYHLPIKKRESLTFEAKKNYELQRSKGAWF